VRGHNYYAPEMVRGPELLFQILLLLVATRPAPQPTRSL